MKKKKIWTANLRMEDDAKNRQQACKVLRPHAVIASRRSAMCEKREFVDFKNKGKMYAAGALLALALAGLVLLLLRVGIDDGAGKGARWARRCS